MKFIGYLLLIGNLCCIALNLAIGLQPAHHDYLLLVPLSAFAAALVAKGLREDY